MLAEKKSKYSGKRGTRPQCPKCHKACNALVVDPLYAYLLDAKPGDVISSSDNWRISMCCTKCEKKHWKELEAEKKIDYAKVGFETEEEYQWALDWTQYDPDDYYYEME